MRSAPSPLPRLAALAAVLGCAALAGFAQQRPPVEEEEPGSKGGVKKKVVVDDDGVAPRKGGGAAVGSPPDARLDELARAADEARSPALRAVFARFVVPADRLNENGTWLRVQPVPLRQAEWPKGVEAVNVSPLDGFGKAREARGVRVADVRAVEHFEAAALAEAEAVLKQKAEPPATDADHLAAAEKLLAAALRFHDYARERQVRRGKTWDDVRDPLAARLRELRLEQLRAAVAAGDAPRVREAGTRLMNAYPRDAAVAAAVAAARVADAERLLQSASHLDHVKARELLDEFESRFPGAGGEAVRKVRAQLRDLAAKALRRAQEKKAVGDTTTAKDELGRAAALDPTLDGVRDLQRELRSGYPILYVGVRHWPVNMSPATARLDSERQVVQLVFEGLLEEVPAEDGSVRYRAGAALAPPAPAAGGREFALRTFDRDPVGRPGFDSHDVVGTLKLLNNQADTWPAYPLAWIGGLPEPRDASAVRVPFALGHPDPRAALTFKVLPARWLAENGKTAEVALAEKPFGTGPFKFHSAADGPGGAREMVFLDNPVYGRWRDRTGLPQLREVRLVDAARVDPVKAFEAGRLHVLPDVPTSDLDKFGGPGSALGGRVQVVTHAANRRVHILAMNLQRSYLQDKALRQGLSLAIDREEILREVFRAGRPDFHRAMTGPFPPTSWATPKGLAAPPPLVNRDLAAAKFAQYLGGSAPKTDLELSYAEDDPRAEDACRRIKAQVESLARDGPNGRRLVINLNRVPTRELLTRVEGEHRYDLAYVPFDYPDDWHPFGLGAALDPAAAGRGGRNWFSFLAKDTGPDASDLRLGQMLNEIRGYRDFAGQLVPRAHEASKLFAECVPFAPLWQLDRHTVVSNALKVVVDDSGGPVGAGVLNPTVLFQGVARWRLD